MSRGFCSCALFFAILFQFCGSARAIKPSGSYAKTPADFGMTYDSLNIRTSDAHRLTAWLCHPPKKQSDKVIILAGGDAGNMSYQLELVRAIAGNIGVDVLLFDYRGFGTSDPIPIDTDAIALPEFANELRSVVTSVKEKLNGDSTKIVIYGRSMGASLAMTVSGIFGGVGGVIAESPYVSQASLESFYNADYQKTGSKRRLHTLNSNLLEPLMIAKQIHFPILIIHGNEETSIQTSEVYHLYDDCDSTLKSLWVVGNADHMQVPYVQTGAFLAGMQSFLQELASN